MWVAKVYGFQETPLRPELAELTRGNGRTLLKTPLISYGDFYLLGEKLRTLTRTNS